MMNNRVDLWNPCLFVLLSLLFMQTEYEKNEVFLPLGYVNLANLIEHAKQFGHFILDNPISGLFNSFFPKNKKSHDYQLLSQITRYPVWRLPLIMDVRMYDNGYVRLTALPTGILLFPQRFASAPHRAELSRPFRAVFQWLIVNGYLSGTWFGVYHA